MHSKRALYKPAVTGKTTPRERRKPLAQGRLVTKPLTDDKDAANVQPDDLPVPLPGLSSGKPVSVREDSSARDQPQLSFHDSPRFVKPSQSLDVSDTESELNASKRSSLNSPREVLVVNASQALVHATRSSEVAVEMMLSQSPARVVCHSPGRVHGNLRNTADVDLAAQIKVDRLPSVTISHTDEVFSDSDQVVPPRKPMYSDNPVVIRHKEHSPPHQSTKPRVVQTLFKDELNDSVDSSKNKSQSPLKESTVNESNSTTHSGHSDASIESRASDISEIIKETNKENFRDDSKVRSVTMPAAGSKAAKKKKAPRFVPSRYMTNPAPTPAAKGPMKAMDRSVMARSSTSLSSTSRKTSCGTSITRKVASVSTTVKRPTGSGSSLTRIKRVQRKTVSASTEDKPGMTPEARVTNGGGKSSTPTAESANLLGADVSVDVSAIGPPSQRFHQSSMCASPSFETFDLHHPPGSGKKKLGMSSSNAFRPPSARKKKSHDWSSSTMGSSQDSSGMLRRRKPDSHVTQLQLDLLYGRYLQWVFIESKAKHAFKQQERHVMHQCKSLWEENERLRQKKEELMVRLTRIKHVNNLDDTLDTQHSGLNTLTSGLAQFQRQYDTLAHALDTTRHQIPTRGVHIPTNEGMFMSDIQHALSESEQLLGELTVMCRQQTPHVDKCATSLENMLQTIQTEKQELHRCGELLAAAKSLGVHESSLQIQHLQSSET